jgi:hypothetical protein
MRHRAKFLVTLALVLFGIWDGAEAQWIEPTKPFERVIPPTIPRSGDTNRIGPPIIGGSPAPSPAPLGPSDTNPRSNQKFLWPYAICLAQDGWCRIERLETNQRLEYAQSVMGRECDCNGVRGIVGLTQIVE